MKIQSYQDPFGNCHVTASFTRDEPVSLQLSPAQQRAMSHPVAKPSEKIKQLLFLALKLEELQVDIKGTTSPGGDETIVATVIDPPLLMKREDR